MGGTTTEYRIESNRIEARQNHTHTTEQGTEARRRRGDTTVMRAGVCLNVHALSRCVALFVTSHVDDEYRHGMFAST